MITKTIDNDFRFNDLSHFIRNFKDEEFRNYLENNGSQLITKELIMVAVKYSNDYALTIMYGYNRVKPDVFLECLQKSDDPFILRKLKLIGMVKKPNDILIEFFK